MGRDAHGTTRLVKSFIFQKELERAMNDATKPPAMLGIAFGLLLSIDLWCLAALLMKALL